MTTMDNPDRSQFTTYDAKVHRNNKVYYVTIPVDTIRKMGLKKDDLVIMKIGRASPPEGF